MTAITAMVVRTVGQPNEVRGQSWAYGTGNDQEVMFLQGVVMLVNWSVRKSNSMQQNAMEQYNR